MALKSIGWWTAWGVMAAYRLLQVVLMMYAGNLLGWLLIVPETLALGFGIVNAFVAKERDYRLVGLWVPFCYAAGIFVISGHAVKTSLPATSLFIVAEALSLWALLCLQTRFSVAAAAWVSLCDRGPYRWIRHPQLAARLLFVLACTLSAGDLVGLAVAGAMTISVVLVEEGMLLGIPAYQSYAQRVRYRLIPGVF